MDDFTPLDEIFIWDISRDKTKTLLSVINGDGSGIEFLKPNNGDKLRCVVLNDSAYHRIRKGDVYEFLEERCGGMIFKKVTL